MFLFDGRKTGTMDSYEIYVNEIKYQIIDEKDVIDLLKSDEEYLIEYIFDKMNQGTGPPVDPAVKEGCIRIRRPPERESNFESEADCQSDLTWNQDDFSQECQEHENISEDVSQFSSGGPHMILDKVNVWSQKGKTLEADNNALEFMLELRSSEIFLNRFNDKKTNKLKLWKEISIELCKKGYLVDAEKCRQKFSNMTKKYVEFVRHCNKTRNDKKKEPIYYDLLHKILGGKDKVQLREISDTIAPKPTVIVEAGEFDAPMYETPTTCIPSTSGLQKKRKEVLTKTDIINKITECNEKNIAIQQETTNRICAAIHEQTYLMEKQLEQKDRLLKIFEEYLKISKSRKRKRDISSESD